MQILIFLQKLREYVNGQWTDFALFVTSFGEPLITFAFLGFVYWCVCKRTGILMALNVGITCTYSHVFKNFLKIDRTWQKNHAIKPVQKALANAGGFSFPSGHSARATAVFASFGLHSFYSKKNLFVLVSTLIISVAVAFSRMFLGVHTLQDVFVGFCMAIAIFFVANFLLNWQQKGKNRDFLLGAFLFLLCFLPMLKFGCISTAGFGIGVAFSFVLEKKIVNFSDASTNTQRIERFVIGFIGIVLIHFCLSNLLKCFLPQKYCPFFSQFFMAFYILFLFPLLFTKCKKNYKQIALAIFAIFLLMPFFSSFVTKTVKKYIKPSASLYQKPILIAHRGYFANYPQNTMSAFFGAVDIGVDMIELDVQMTKDGVIVIEHDANLSRIGQNGAIANYTYAELLQMDFGAWFSKDFENTKIATLQELLSFMKAHPNVKIYIELKDIGDNADFIKKVYSLVKNEKMMEQCYFASFNKNYLLQFKQLDNTCKTIYIVSNYDKSTFNANFVDIFSLYEKKIAQEYINIAHKKNKAVFAWTIDEPKRVIELKKMGIDGFCTNQVGRTKIALQDEYNEWMTLYKNSFAMPALDEKNLPELFSEAVVQGLTKTDDYIFISAYTKTNKNSLLFVLANDGKWLNTFDLGFVAHVGGIAFDEKHLLLWITNANGNVCCIDYLQLQSLIGTKNKTDLILAPATQTIFDAELLNHNNAKVASFLDIYNGFLYVGSYTIGCNGKLKKFDISNIYEPKVIFEWTIPQKTQGITIFNEKGTDYIYLSCSANTEDSLLQKYRLSTDEKTLGKAIKTIKMPEGSEQIEIDNNGTITFLFESACVPYKKTARIRNDQVWIMHAF